MQTTTPEPTNEGPPPVVFHLDEIRFNHSDTTLQPGLSVGIVAADGSSQGYVDYGLAAGCIDTFIQLRRFYLTNIGVLLKRRPGSTWMAEVEAALRKGAGK